MQRLFWSLFYGDSDQKPSISKSKEERPRTLWERDGDGWRKVVDSTAATLSSLASLTVTPQQKEHRTSQELPPVRGRVQGDEGSDVPSSDDNVVTVDPTLDALGGYQEKLKGTATSLQSLLVKWEATKEEVIGDDTGLRQYANLRKPHPGSGVLHTVRAFFENLFEKIKEDLEPADDELHELLTKTHAAVQPLCNHLEDACVDLQKNNKDEKAQHMICIDMCNTSIEIINDLIKLIDNIRTELEFCLEAEKITENAAKQLVLLAILIVTKIPLPEINYSFAPTYRNFLYNEIEEEKKEIDKFESEVFGELRKAMAAIKKKEIEWIEKKKKSEADQTHTPETPRLIADNDKLLSFKGSNPSQTTPRQDDGALTLRKSF